MTINEAAVLSTELLHVHDVLSLWKVSFNKRKGSFGLCSYKKKEIQLSSIMVPVMTDEAIRMTILHEIAHALTLGHGHDYVWTRKCIELGGDGKRVGESDKYEGGKEGRTMHQQAISKYTLSCPCCGEKYYKNRLPKRASSCGKHRGSYNPMYKLIVTQNY